MGSASPALLRRVSTNFRMYSCAFRHDKALSVVYEENLAVKGPEYPASISSFTKQLKISVDLTPPVCHPAKATPHPAPGSFNISDLLGMPWQTTKSEATGKCQLGTFLGLPVSSGWLTTHSAASPCSTRASMASSSAKSSG